MSIIRADSIKNRVGDGAPDFPNGITVTGIVTATTLNQNVIGIITATGLDISGNASIGGVLTYEDVKNVDSVGVVTARSGIDCNGDIDVDGHTNLDNVNIVGVTTFAGNILPGTDSSHNIGSNGVRFANGYFDTLYGNGANLTGITQTTINNNANNKIITGSGTANTLEAESGLTYDGTSVQVGAAGDIRIAGGTWAGEYNSGIKIQPDASNSFFQYHGSLYFRNTSGSNKIEIDQSGNLVPGVNNDQDIGSSSYRWRNLYMQDLQLSNYAQKDEGGNDVDGTWGDYTIQEGESDLFLINNRNGKKYKFMLKEVD